MESLKNPRREFWYGSLPHAVGAGDQLARPSEQQQRALFWKVPHATHEGKSAHQKLVYCLVFNWERRQIVKLIFLTGKKKVRNLQMSSSLYSESSVRYFNLDAWTFAPLWGRPVSFSKVLGLYGCAVCLPFPGIHIGRCLPALQEGTV